MEFINEDQTRINIKLRFNEGGECGECVRYTSGIAYTCHLWPCSPLDRKDGKRGNWIIDEEINENQ